MKTNSFILLTVLIDMCTVINQHICMVRILKPCDVNNYVNFLMNINMLWTMSTHVIV